MTLGHPNQQSFEPLRRPPVKGGDQGQKKIASFGSRLAARTSGGSITVFLAVFAILAFEGFNSVTTGYAGFKIGSTALGVIGLAVAAGDLFLLPRATLPKKYTHEQDEVRIRGIVTWLIFASVGFATTAVGVYLKAIDMGKIHGNVAIGFALFFAAVAQAVRYLAQKIGFWDAEKVEYKKGNERSGFLIWLDAISYKGAQGTFVIFELLNGYTNYLALEPIIGNWSVIWAIGLFTFDTFMLWKWVNIDNGDSLESEMERDFKIAMLTSLLIGTALSGLAFWYGILEANVVTVFWQQMAIAVGASVFNYIARYANTNYLVKHDPEDDVKKPNSAAVHTDHAVPAHGQRPADGQWYTEIEPPHDQLHAGDVWHTLRGKRKWTGTGWVGLQSTLQTSTLQRPQPVAAASTPTASYLGKTAPQPKAKPVLASAPPPAVAGDHTEQPPAAESTQEQHPPANKDDLDIPTFLKNR